jgi:hypothetical protein
MRRCVLLLTITLTLSFAACKKDKQEVVNGITAQKGTINWNTTNVNTGFKPLAAKDTLFITGQNGEENIVIAIKQKGAGTYRPAEFKAYFYVTIGMDVILGQYQSYNDPGNTIVITDYDEANHIVKGTFNFVLHSYYNYNNALPDKITFTKGKINTQLSDVFFDPFK